VKCLALKPQAEPLVAIVRRLSILAHGELRQAGSRSVKVGFATELLDKIKGDDKIRLIFSHNLDMFWPRAQRDIGPDSSMAG
jgi:hypothetical protein